MKDRGTYVLLALFFAGLVGLWVADFARVPTRADLDRMKTRVLSSLIDTKPDDLLKVEILGGDESLVFERRDDHRWQMTRPFDVAADPSKVETLAYNLKEMSRRPDSATLEPDLGRYGLDRPERTIKLWGAATDAPIATLDVGRVSLDRRYVRAGGSDGVEVVDARKLDLLRLAAIQWRDREVFRVPSFEVDAVTLTAGGRALKLRRGRGTWHVVADPIRLPASEAKVDGLVADLGSLRVIGDDRFAANDVKPADLDRFGLKSPLLTIEVDSARVDRLRGPQVLQVGKPVEGKPGQVYAKRGDQDDVVILDQRVLKDLKPEVNAFRSPKVADFIPGRVIRIGVAAVDGTGVEAARIGNDWAIVAPYTAKGDRPTIQKFLKALDQLQTGIFLTPDEVPDAGLDPPALTIKLWQAPDARDPSASVSTAVDPKGDLAVNLRIGRRDFGRKVIYARIEGDSTILALPDSANDVLPRNPLAFRDRQVLGLDVDQVEQIKFVGPSRTITLNPPIFRVGRQNMGLAPPGWWMVEPVHAPADPASVGQLLRMLANLRAESFVGDRPDGSDKFGLKSPALTLVWAAFPESSVLKPRSMFDQGDGKLPLDEHSLRIGSQVPDRPNVRYAKLDDSPVVFTVGPDVLGVLNAEWHDRRVFTFEAAQVRRVRLGWSDRELVLAPAELAGGRGWAPVPGSDAPDFDPAPVRSIVEAASKLTTGRFAQYQGDFAPEFGLTPPRLTIRFEFEDGSPARTIRVGSSAGNGFVAATTEEGSGGAAFFVPESTFGPLLKAPRRSGELPDNVFAP